MDESGVALGQLAVPVCHSLELFKVRKKVLRQVPGAVSDWIIPGGLLSVGSGRDGRYNALRGEQKTDGVAVEGLVSNQFAGEDAVEGTR